MAPPRKPVCEKPGKDAGFAYLDDLPCGVPPVERPPGSASASAVPVGPAEVTYYFPIGSPGFNPTGVFFPSGFQFTPTINVILYFHGFKLGEFKTIDQYWKGGLHGIKLREDVNNSGKKAVLIAPTLGDRPGSMDIGDMGGLAQGVGGDAFLAEVLSWIKRYVPQYAGGAPTIGKLVLAGHSGAGVILNTLARDMRAAVSEVWGFDSTYGQSAGLHKKLHAPDVSVAEGWLDLARSHGGTKFFFHWATPGPGKNALKIGKEGLSNVVVEQTGTGPVEEADASVKAHFGALTANFAKRVRDATCF